MYTAHSHLITDSDRRNSFEKNVEEDSRNMDITGSSSSETSPASVMPHLGDLTLEKDADRKTLKKDLYDLKLRIYYMEQREKILNGEDGDDIYQKYMDLQTEFEKLSKNLDEKDDLLLKAERVTSYLREEKSKSIVEFQEKEKLYKEHVQQLEKELENMRLCNPKFGLHSTVFMSGDSADSYLLPAAADQKRINDLEYQIHQLSLELANMKANNDQLENTVFNLQREIHLRNKVISDLNNDMVSIQKERDLAVENRAKNDEFLNKLDKEKEKQEMLITKTREDNGKVPKVVNLPTEKTPLQEAAPPVSMADSGVKSEKAAATLIRHLLAENKQMNMKLRKVKDEMLLIKELCSTCPVCVQEKKAKKSSAPSQRQKSAASTTTTSEEEKSDVLGFQSDSESEPVTDNFVKLAEPFELRAMLREKDKIIKQLRAENKKRTYNLQELVNKELWDKNREIEKLNKQCEKLKYELDYLRKQSTHANGAHPMRELQSSFVRYCSEGKENNLLGVSDDVKLLKEQLRACLEEKRALLLKIGALECKITSDEEQKAQTSLVHNLRLECAKHRDEFEEAEKARKDAFNACAMLTNRLEELACFLESLLTHDATALNARRRLLLRQAIERSREISKSFSCTFGAAADADNCSVTATKFESSVDLSAPILPDYSEINLSFSCDDDDDDEDEHDFAASPNRKEIDCCAAAHRTLKAETTDGGVEDTADEAKESVDGSDAYGGTVQRNIFSSQELNARSELMLCSNRLCRADDDTADAAGTETTDDSQPMARRPFCEACCGAGHPNSAPLTSSVTVSSDDAAKLGAHLDSESDARGNGTRFLVTSSGTKLKTRRTRPERCYTTDSDGSLASDKKSAETNEMRSMRRRIRTLQRINDALRNDLKRRRSFEAQGNVVEKTDVEKIREKTKLRNLLNKINLENCVDTEKYRDCVENVRRNLRDLSKHVKAKKIDKGFVWTKLQEVRENFDLSELCCAKLNHHLSEARVRSEMLGGMLEETQSKFEQVMVDMRTTKLAYNGVLMEHEQNIFKYQQREAENEKLRQKLDSVEGARRHLECDLQKTVGQNCALEEEQRKSALLKEQLDAASARIAELESFVATNDQTLEELNACKANIACLSEQNEKLLRDLDELCAYKARIEEYEMRLNTYKATCEKLELELFEKGAIEKLYKEQCARFEEQIEEKNAISDTLKRTDLELVETRVKIQSLEAQLRGLDEVVREKENAIQARDAHIVEVQRDQENGMRLLEELKRQTQWEIHEKSATAQELRNLLAASDEKTHKFEREIASLKGLLSVCEDEKRDFRAKIEKQVEEHENLKKQHEHKMKYLLAQIVAYRTEEESSLSAHRQLVEQIEQAQRKKEVWKRSIQEWKDKYDELRVEKEQIERKLQTDGCRISSGRSIDNELVKCGVERDWFVKEAQLRYQLDVATLTTSHVILEWTRLANEKLRLQRDLQKRDKPYYVNHLESVKTQLETRVKELETANEEMETRLQRLQTNKVGVSDLEELTSDDSSAAPSPTKAFASKNGLAASANSTSILTATTTGYSSSLPSSPSRARDELGSYASNSLANSPSCDAKIRLHASSVNGRLANDDEMCAASPFIGASSCDKPFQLTPPRKDSSEHNATSPDLGIDSDHGRNNSFDFDLNRADGKARCEIDQLEEENQSLKHELGRTRKELEETLAKLTALNKNKKKMEKAIFEQIYETKHILQRARVNLEDGNVDTTSR